MLANVETCHLLLEVHERLLVGFDADVFVKLLHAVFGVTTVFEHLFKLIKQSLYFGPQHIPQLYNLLFVCKHIKFIFKLLYSWNFTKTLQLLRNCLKLLLRNLFELLSFSIVDVDAMTQNTALICMLRSHFLQPILIALNPILQHLKLQLVRFLARLQHRYLVLKSLQDLFQLIELLYVVFKLLLTYFRHNYALNPPDIMILRKILLALILEINEFPLIRTLRKINEKLAHLIRQLVQFHDFAFNILKLNIRPLLQKRQLPLNSVQPLL